ncbi:MAG: DUF4241 domain-containing protein, partial [Duncaniella sp.]|nr:DUF4241 domain-containing protein [Duncaniella sp.]
GYPVDAGMMCFCDAEGAKKYAEFLDALRFYAKSGYLRSPRDIAAWRSTFPEARAAFSYPSALPLPYRIVFMLLNRLH